MKTIDDILKKYNVKSYKETDSGLIAIHKKIYNSWFWLYFRYCGKKLGYVQTGSTEKFEK